MHDTLKERADREPIRLPGSPYWNVFKRFGRDEMVALAISVVATLAFSVFTTSVLILAVAGPVLEKIGFFPTHLWEASSLYRATPLPERLPFSQYLKSALKNGSLSLLEDVAVHDPLYIALFLWLSLYPGIPLWLIASFSFLVAVAAVAGLEVTWTELRYAYFKRRFRSAGFSIDSYREARFYIRSGQRADAVIEKLKQDFGLREIERLEYHDVYFENRLPRFSGRAPVVRLRRRTAGKSSRQWQGLSNMAKTGYMQSLQVVYTRPQEESSGRLDQFRFFSVRKDKLYFPIDDERMPESLDELAAPWRKLLRAGKEFKRVTFERTILLDPTDTLYAAVDRLPDGRDGCIIELKIRTDMALFLAAMRFVMMEFPATHTTRQKTQLELF